MAHTPNLDFSHFFLITFLKSYYAVYAKMTESDTLWPLSCQEEAGTWCSLLDFEQALRYCGDYFTLITGFYCWNYFPWWVNFFPSMCLFHQGKSLNNSFSMFEGCWFVLGLFFSFPEIHLIYHALKCAAEITVQFQEKLCREQAKIAHYLYHTELDNNLLFLTLRGANWAMRSDCWDIPMLLQAQWCECFQYGSAYCLHLHLMPTPSTGHEGTKVLSDVDDSRSLNTSHARTYPPSHRRHQMPLDEADVPSQPDYDRKVTLIYFGFIKSSKAPARANETWGRRFKEVII